MSLSTDFSYRCSDCGKNFSITPERMVCDICTQKQSAGQPLWGVLEVEFKGSPSSHWKTIPVEDEFFPSIPVGKTPLWKPENLRREFGFSGLFIKDDTCNPTFSFKDRASYLVAAFAQKTGVREVALASTGNAASSMAGVGAAAGLKVTVFIPSSAPKAKMLQSLQYGAQVFLINGNYDKAYDLSMEYCRRRSVLCRNTGFNPLTIEGKKTVSLEIFDQLGSAPDSVFVPTGDGVILAGVYKGFEDLLKLGKIQKIPKIYCVQAEGSSALTEAFETGIFSGKATQTLADSISVDIPRNGYLALKKLKKYSGTCVRISDRAILEAQKKLSSSTGLFAEPAAAAAFAGFMKVKEQLNKNDLIVLLITGSGLKDIDNAQKIVQVPQKTYSNIEEILEDEK